MKLSNEGTRKWWVEKFRLKRQALFEIHYLILNFQTKHLKK
jgi:hypothetical protein